MLPPAGPARRRVRIFLDWPAAGLEDLENLGKPCISEPRCENIATKNPYTPRVRIFRALETEKNPYPPLAGRLRGKEIPTRPWPAGCAEKNPYTPLASRPRGRNPYTPLDGRPREKESMS